MKVSSASKISGPSVPYAPPSASAAVGQAAASVTALRVPPLPPLSSLYRSVRNSWSFKGYSLSLYKSLLYPLASGVSFRLPITQNFVPYFSRPYLPAVSTSLGVYYPPSVGLFLSVSVPLNLYLLTLLSVLTSSPRPQISQKILYRAGCSFSVRYSSRHGLRVIRAPWIMVLPLVTRLLELLLSPVLQAPLLLKVRRYSERRTAGLGVTSAAYRDGMSCSGMMSLNGFFFGRREGGEEVQRDEGVIGE